MEKFNASNEAEKCTISTVSHSILDISKKIENKTFILNESNIKHVKRRIEGSTNGKKLISVLLKIEAICDY